ncbi:DinB family protein [Streptomyces kanamyceticus]|uniref:DinB family protein n=1 Tax=Streptomyces kanamyceticus TaxID=1967 RepID=A0A5J6GDB4_STRKN|nr:DinB family protein [Streptomyces kanamyceticus]QEU92554.1 DinB family protein [Streptomyces kanamyceticus]
MPETAETRTAPHRRAEPPRSGAGERASLVAFLQYQRETLAMKCAGLTADQLRERAVPPSEMSLLGLVRHLAEVERSWFGSVLNGEDPHAHWRSRVPGEHADFDVADADPDEAFEIWHAQCARSRALVDATDSFDATVRFRDEEYSLRYILTHMIEEYARHNGHADFLRERIDGVTGE